MSGLLRSWSRRGGFSVRVVTGRGRKLQLLLFCSPGSWSPFAWVVSPKSRKASLSLDLASIGGIASAGLRWVVV